MILRTNTGYNLREGSKILAERFEEDRRKRRLAVIRKNLYVAVKAIDEEIKAA